MHTCIIISNLILIIFNKVCVHVWSITQCVYMYMYGVAYPVCGSSVVVYIESSSVISSPQLPARRKIIIT